MHCCFPFSFSSGVVSACIKCNKRLPPSIAILSVSSAWSYYDSFRVELAWFSAGRIFEPNRNHPVWRTYHLLPKLLVSPVATYCLLYLSPVPTWTHGHYGYAWHISAAVDVYPFIPTLSTSAMWEHIPCSETQYLDYEPPDGNMPTPLFYDTKSPFDAEPIRYQVWHLPWFRVAMI